MSKNHMHNIQVITTKQIYTESLERNIVSLFQLVSCRCLERNLIHPLRKTENLITINKDKTKIVFDSLKINILFAVLYSCLIM